MAKTKYMRAQKRPKYSAAERRAYNIGLGAGLCGVRLGDVAAINLIDSRQGLGQDEKLTAICRKGMVKGYKERYSAPFENQKRQGKRK